MKLVPSLCVLVGLVLPAYASTLPEFENSPSKIEKGVVVEWLTKGSEGERAGVQPGDVLLGWVRGDRQGEIESPSYLPYIRFEQAPRGRVRIDGLRGHSKHSWFLGSETWGIASRPNFSGEFLALYRQSQELAQAGKLSLATEQLRTAAAMAQKTPVPWLGSWFLARIAQLLFDVEQWDAADNVFGEALELAAGSGAPVRADLLRQRAEGFAYRDDLTHAEKYYELSLAEWSTLGNKTMAVAHFLLELGEVALAKGDLGKAQDCFRQALSIADKLAPASSQRAVALANLGVLYQNRGELAQAEEYYGQALSLEQRYYPRSEHVVRTLANLGTLAQQRGDLARAESYFRKALRFIEKRDPGSLDAATVLANLGDCVLDRTSPTQAERFHRRALAIREKIAPGSLTVASSLAALGRTARLRGDRRSAREYYEQALAVSESLVPAPPEIASFLIGLGDLFRDNGEVDKAENAYRLALKILERVAPGSLNHAETLAALAATTRKRGQLDAAAQLYREALDALESKTERLGGVEEDRFRYRAKHARYYQEYTDLLLDQGQTGLALKVLEGSRARSLLETVARGQIDLRQGVDPLLLARQRKLLQLLNAKSSRRIRLLGENHTEEQVAALDAEIAELLDQYEQAKTEVRAHSPGYAALTQPRPLSPGEMQQLLDANTILVEYALGDERSHLWVVSKDSLQAHVLPGRKEIEVAARRVYELLTAPNRSINGETEAQKQVRVNRAEAAYPQAAARLSKLILGPLTGLAPGTRLLVVSDGALQYIPFAALPVPAVAGSVRPAANPGAREKSRPRASSGWTPLVVQYEVVNLPSASVVAELRRSAAGRTPAPKIVAVLADPVFDAEDERVSGGRTGNSELDQTSKAVVLRGWPRSSLSPKLTRSASDIGWGKNGSVHLGRLLYTRQEADAIISVAPLGKGMKAVDFAASRAMAMDPALAQYRIVHFATHGLLDSKHPELSGLVLSMVDKHGRPQQGFLELEDIYNLKLPADLVVLSGCETGLGEQINGEGLIGLTRGFMYAGASRVIASLWSVNDSATAELMRRFYRAMLQDKLPAAAALRAAQITLWKQRSWQSPYYWAAFQLQGEWR